MYTTTVFKIPSRLSAVWEHPFWETKENIVQDREPSDYLTSFVIRETGACRFVHSRLVSRTYPIRQTLGWLTSWVATRSGYSTRDGAVRLGRAREQTMLLMLAWQHLPDTVNKCRQYHRSREDIAVFFVKCPDDKIHRMFNTTRTPLGTSRQRHSSEYALLETKKAKSVPQWGGRTAI